MRAGLLDRTIAIERVTVGATDTGAVAEEWSTLATLRAQLVQSAPRSSSAHSAVVRKRP
jgi:hypothetical protein